MRLLDIFPFTYQWIIARELVGTKTILDVGCGDGYLISLLNKDKKFRVVGVDLYKPYLKIAKERGVFKRLIRKDIRYLKFPEKSFDVVMSSQVVEHLGKRESQRLIREMERIARYKVLVGTTNGFFPFDAIEGGDKNPLQVHKSGWSPEEFRKQGYKVYGQAAGFIYKPGGLGHRFKELGYVFYAISYLLSPLIYLFPKFSTYLVAVLDKGAGHR